ncbi:LPXTG cell wall anchor domain-containing protein [Secundilactobacillus silagei]|uniref:LPXTG cell wall anchor domain-containing protein n=1 Tax=Secundilactobacillus silagei TaxID=1293415 RepID=UPI0006D0C674|nr:LPXTG cell wall anchor domain-containing protein [Secundilactobacillus silagei]
MQATSVKSTSVKPTSEATPTILHQTVSNGRVAEKAATMVTTKVDPTNHQMNLATTKLPQTNEAAPAKSTLIGGLLLSILGWFGFARRKHEKD